MMDEGSAVFAWRLFATLEGGTLLLATSALLAHAARNRITSRNRSHLVVPRLQRPLRVSITNETSPLSREISQRLEALGCTLRGNTTSGAVDSDADDALVVVGSEFKSKGFDGLATVVADDIYINLKLLDSLINRVVAGGRVVWVSCRGDADSGAFSGATNAFDKLLRSQFEQVIARSQCEAVWLGRQSGAEQATDSVIAALMPGVDNPNNSHNSLQSTWFSIRRMATTVWSWLKMIT